MDALPYKTMLQQNIVSLALAGLDVEGICARLGCAKATVYEVLSSPEVREYISSCRYGAYLGQASIGIQVQGLLQKALDVYRAALDGEDLKVRMQAADRLFKLQSQILKGGLVRPPVEQGVEGGLSDLVLAAERYDSEVDRVMGNVLDSGDFDEEAFTSADGDEFKAYMRRRFEGVE